MLMETVVKGHPPNSMRVKYSDEKTEIFIEDYEQKEFSWARLASMRESVCSTGFNLVGIRAYTEGIDGGLALRFERLYPKYNI